MLEMKGNTRTSARIHAHEEGGEGGREREGEYEQI